MSKTGKIMKKVEAGKMKRTGPFYGLGRVLSLFLLLAGGGYISPPPVHAVVPVKFTYQGNVRQAGFLVNGQRSMTFRIYNSSDVDTGLLWTSPPYNVSLSTGVFRVTLEPSTISGPDWEAGSLWLEMWIEGNRMSPREALTSSPYSLNSLMLSGKRYTTAASAPAGALAGDLWMDTVTNTLKYWNGSVWMLTSGAGVPGLHAATHMGTGTDPLVSLGTHTVTGSLTLEGALNPSANLQVGGGGYSVTFSSSVSAGWFYGDGSGLNNLNASRITLGLISGDRIGNVIVSTHIVDGSIQNQDLAVASINADKINQSGCGFGALMQWNGAQWSCGSPGAVVEWDPLAILKGDVLQSTTFYVSSGTVNDFNVNNSLKVMGTALIKGAPGQQGLSVEATGNVGVGMSGAAARLEVKGVNTQNYSFAVSTGTAHQLVVSTSGAVGIGTENPAAKLDVTGAGVSGEYIAIFNSGSKLAAWLRNK